MKHQDLINRLTLEEKCALLSGDTAFTTRAYPHHGIPAMQFSDGPHGLRLQAAGANHLGIGGSVPATCFPTAATVANSWDPSLGERLGTALGEEALAEKVDVVLGPGLNIKRSPLCGRNFEYFSEDPLVAGDMAAGYVRGIQSQGVSACPKHFAVNSQETRRQGSDSQVDERTLRELYLAGFERVVKNARPKCLMSSYNMVNGTYANENQHLLREVLRDEWGYDGAVVTDWQGSVDHVAGVKAGSDFEMPAHGMPAVRELVGAVREGRISEAEVDAQVDEALELILTTTAATRAAGNSFDRLAHHQIAHDIAAQSIVMLKNEDHILPLAPATRVALVGDFADNPRYQGAGSSLVNCTKLEKLTGVIADTELEYVGYEPAFNRDGGSTEAMAQAAADLARRADVVLMCLGLDESRESEGAERLDMSMDPAQVHALELVAEANPNVVVLLSAGSAVECDWVANAKAVLYLALGGQAGASAALDVVTGAVNPSGKLTETWARRLADTPTAGRFPADGRIAEYREGLFVGYRYYQTAGVDVAFPFGFGLSYTTFEYGPLQAEVVKDAGSDVSVRCSVAIANTGERAGAEVVQLYVAKPDGEVFRPAQELRAYEKVRLEPGETTTVTFDLGSRAFAYFNIATDGWEIEHGAYELRAAASCEDVRSVATVTLAGTAAANPYAGQDLGCYRSGNVQDVPDVQWAAILGRPVPKADLKIDDNLCFRDLNHGRSPIFWLVWLVLTQIVKSSTKKGRPNLNALFIYNMPLHVLVKGAGGWVDQRMVDALVLELRGFWVIGLVLCLVRFVQNVLANNAMARKLQAAATPGAPSDAPTPSGAVPA
ncbi:glycoside hydrolase family 3 C-terminal domain-containing protein [Olsenella sp. YH-ols2217]|uniref:Glycoside hydrolase family 3 C-terminal domain-containing protein n=1 Tax=Kribbibacterium absianum TaxID=3044210 RepID=A0ABT6ZJL9_9ACTN|nr:MULTISPECIES: glycoside hydrolase family 3 C-terminal domain-containing protein [unclassified Olsenella]MDJ1122776.1 glycoside hydrolase family 3 C-terminal domain-containing protein [Olsenella sp. YH-ols2216]MDJ1129241.1 glycoside hydrolase family 3 C-terminal domain-containing protein [Olsenella sp. YH-ols2217]